MNGLIQDLRYAVRAFARNPGFTAAALLSVAIGVGANSSIFSVASALLLRPLPYQDAERLAILWSRSPGLGIAEDWFSTAQYFDIKTGHQGFEQVAIAIGGNYNLTGDGEPERIGTVRVSSNLLPMLGARPALGRLFTANEDVDLRIVAGHYFRAMEIPLLQGRLFTDHDTRSQPRVVVIDDFMAQQLWPNEEPLGKRIGSGGIDATADSPWLTVVGVVGRVKQYTLDGDSRIAMYLPHTQSLGRGINVVLRSRGDPAALATTVRREIRALDPDLPIYNVRTMTERVDESLARRRFSMLLLTLFAALALGLATIGIYGVIAYLVSQGTRELGIRMALGATPRGILLLILRHGVSVALIGVGAGLAGAFVLTRFMRNLLYGVDATDPATFTTVALLLTGIALAASYLPARRAARIDLMISLRSE